MNVQSDWPPPDGHGPAPGGGARCSSTAGQSREAIEAFLAEHDFPLAEPGAVTFA